MHRAPAYPKGCISDSVMLLLGEEKVIQQQTREQCFSTSLLSAQALLMEVSVTLHSNMFRKQPENAKYLKSKGYEEAVAEEGLPARSGLGIHVDSDPANENFLQKRRGAATTLPA